MQGFLLYYLQITASVLVSVALPCDRPFYPLHWEHVGPAGYVDKDHLLQPASAGAAQAAVHLNERAWMIATANGGIWKTADLLAAPEPHWSQVLDNQPVACTSISAMESHGSTVLAGCGAATSSEMGWDWNVANTGDWGGVMVSRDAGTSWAMTAFPINYFVTAIVIRSPTSFVVAARSHFHRRDDGGVWVSPDGGVSWNRTLARPVYDLALEPSSGMLLAALPWTDDGDSVLASLSGGMEADWMSISSGLSWDGRVPFYLTFALGTTTIFVGALTVNPSQLSDTASAIYQLPVAELLIAARHANESSKSWHRVAGGPPRLDRDGMPKDRMALLVHPHDDEILFVAGNADALVWRVFWRAGTWIASAGKADTIDGSAPHADCRRYFWEPMSSSLILLSDGGAFLREQPDRPGGRWRSLSGDTGAMEFLSADWDPVGKRWVGGAQDNSIQVSPINSSATSRALGVIGGDGAVTAVDTVPSSPRLWGATQNLGNIVDDDGPKGELSSIGDDDNCTGFGFFQDKHYMCIPLLKWFTVNQFLYFVQPFALLSNDPTQVFLFASASKNTPSGIYRLHVPYETKDPDDLVAPVLEVPVAGVQMVIAGGSTEGKPDPSVLVAMNATALLHRNLKSSGKVLVHNLPEQYAEPVVFDYPTSDTYTLGPCSHDRTISLSVSPADSSLLAISGWTNILDNSGTERVWVSEDAGVSFTDVTYNLREATGSIGQVRPSALLLVPLTHAHALLVGTVSGVFVTFIGKVHRWIRFGNCSTFPLVLVAGLSYQPRSDTIVAATMGRGVYVVHGASGLLQSMYEDITELHLGQTRFV